MKLRVLIAVAGWSVACAMSQSAEAAPISVNVAGTVTDSFMFSGELWPVGTFVSGSFILDVGPGGILDERVNSVSGSMGWTIGAQPHTLTFTGTGGLGAITASGLLGFQLNASDPLTPEIDAIFLFADVHENPFLSSTPFYDAMLGSDIVSFGLIATRGTIGFRAGSLVPNPTFTVTATPATVPEPGTLSLVGIGLLAAIRRRHRR